MEVIHHHPGLSISIHCSSHQITMHVDHNHVNGLWLITILQLTSHKSLQEIALVRSRRDGLWLRLLAVLAEGPKFSVHDTGQVKTLTPQRRATVPLWPSWALQKTLQTPT